MKKRVSFRKYICTTPGCGKRGWCKGVCKTCYYRIRTYGFATAGPKRKGRPEQDLPADEVRRRERIESIERSIGKERQIYEAVIGWRRRAEVAAGIKALEAELAKEKAVYGGAKEDGDGNGESSRPSGRIETLRRREPA